MVRLAEVVQIKLDQQQQLLIRSVPDLTAKQQALQEQAGQLAARISETQQQPMAQHLWLDDTEQNYAQLQRMLSRAQDRVTALTAAGRDVRDAEIRLMRLRGILQWHYQYNRAERHWQLGKLQQQLTTQLKAVDIALNRLNALDGKTEHLLRRQQQLTALTTQENQFTAAVAQQQQQLLGQLNHGLQQLRLQEREQLLEMRRLNTQAIARVMEQVLLSSQEAQ